MPPYLLPLSLPPLVPSTHHSLSLPLSFISFPPLSLFLPYFVTPPSLPFSIFLFTDLHLLPTQVAGRPGELELTTIVRDKEGLVGAVASRAVDSKYGRQLTVWGSDPSGIDNIQCVRRVGSDGEGMVGKDHWHPRAIVLLMAHTHS